MIEGITAGLILSLALFPGTVWLAKVGVVGTKRQVFAVGLAFALSQMAVAVCCDSRLNDDVEAPLFCALRDAFVCRICIRLHGD